jgi:integrase
MASHGITLTSIRNLKLGTIVWDGVIPGLNVRRRTGNVITASIKYRTAEGRQRWHKIGRIGPGSPWTPELVRGEALRLLGAITGATTAGVKTDPALIRQDVRKGMTVAKLCDLYLAEAKSGALLTKKTGLAKTESTIRSDETRIKRHIKPLLGDRLVAAVVRKDIEEFQKAVTAGETAKRDGAGRGAATRALGLLGGIFSFAVGKNMRSDNPVRGVTRAADGKRDRRLSHAEYAALGKALREAEVQGIWASATAVVRFLAFTGWRKDEAESLSWTRVDLPRRVATLARTKTGRSGRALGQPACAVLQERGVPNGGLVFAAPRDGIPLDLHDGYWARISKLAGLPSDITPHTLRHSFASEAGGLGYADSKIAQLIGHKGKGTTARYIHGSDAELIAIADKVATHIAALMAG